jgi:hypothetical protein
VHIFLSGNSKTQTEDLKVCSLLNDSNPSSDKRNGCHDETGEKPNRASHTNPLLLSPEVAKMAISCVVWIYWKDLFLDIRWNNPP